VSVRFASPAVNEKFAAYGRLQRARLMALRDIIFEVAAATSGVGRLEETLKLGQPSYLTPETKSGTTLRFDAHPEGARHFTSIARPT
jgi:hypothetical protein